MISSETDHRPVLLPFGPVEVCVVVDDEGITLADFLHTPILQTGKIRDGNDRLIAIWIEQIKDYAYVIPAS